MIERAAVIAEAREWKLTREGKRTPFHHQAALKGVGCDCIGLVAGVALAVGVPNARAWFDDTRFRGYSKEPNPTQLLQACAEYLDEIRNEDAQIGDVLLFTFVKEPMHFGFLSRDDPRQVIHAYEPVGFVTENRLDTKWERRLLKSFRLRGVA